MARFLTLTPNPAVDVTYRVTHQRIGETMRVSEVRRAPGGKGINVARALHALGRDVTSLQPLGGASGSWVADALTKRGIPVLDCAIAGETRTTVAIVDDIVHPTLLAEPGPTLSPAEWSHLGLALADAARAGDWLVIAGSFPHGSRPEDLALLIAAAHSKGALVAVDTSGPFLWTAVASRADLVKANEEEVVEATGERDCWTGARSLSQEGACVMVSRGALGSILVRADGYLHEQPAVPDISGNPTGAGDAATAGLVAAFAEGLSDSTALRWAALCGAAAVLNPIAGEIDVGLLPELSQRLGPTPPNPSKRSST